MRLISRRRHNAVHAGLQIPVRPELQHIGNIDRDAAGVRFHPLPTPIRRQNLQRRDRLPEQQRQRAEVRVPLRVHVLELRILLCRARVVQHVPQMAVRDIIVLVPVRQRVLRQFEHKRDQRQQLLHRVLRDVALETLNFLAVLVDDIRVRARELGREFEDVVHLDVVAQAREDFDAA